MAVSKIRTIACLHSVPRPSLASPHIQINTFASESFLTVDNAPDISSQRQIRQRYNFSRCVSPGEDCMPEVDDLVRIALQGCNAAAIFMSTGPSDTFDRRQVTIHQLLCQLDEMLKPMNESRKRAGIHQVNMDYAFLCFTDDSCYDLRADRKLKRSYVIENGLDPIMKRVVNGNEIWTNTKEGSRNPFVLKIRLSDGRGFLGTLTIIDLLFPWHHSPAPDHSRIEFTFRELVTTIKDYSKSDFEGSISNENQLLTKLMTACFCGPYKTVVFMHINEYPEHVLSDTVEALEFLQTLRGLRTVTIRNEVDRRAHEMHKQQLSSLQRKYESEKSRSSSLESELKVAVQQLNIKDMQLRRSEVEGSRVRHESKEYIYHLQEKLTEIKSVMELQRSKSTYEESKHITKAVVLEGEILQLKSDLLCAKTISKKHMQELEAESSAIHQQQESIQEQMHVIQQQELSIQDLKDELVAAKQENERNKTVIDTQTVTVSQLEEQLNSKQALLQKKHEIISRQKNVLTGAKQRLDELVDEVATKDRIIEEKENIISNLNDKLAKKAKEMVNMRKQSLERKRTSESIEGSESNIVESLMTELATANSELADAKRDITKAKRDLTKIRREKSRLEQEQKLASESAKLSGDSNIIIENLKDELEDAKQEKSDLHMIIQQHERLLKKQERLLEEKTKIIQKEAQSTTKDTQNQTRPAAVDRDSNIDESSIKDGIHALQGGNDAHEISGATNERTPLPDHDEDFQEATTRSVSASTKRARKNLSRKPRQKQQQGSNTENPQPKIRRKKQQQSTETVNAQIPRPRTRSSSPSMAESSADRRPQQQPNESTLSSGVDLSPVLEYLGDEFEPVLRLPDVDTNDDIEQSDQMVTTGHMVPQSDHRAPTEDREPQSVLPAAANPESQSTAPSAGEPEHVNDSQPQSQRQPRKRRRLMDLKKITTEDYEGDLSPLAKVNRILQDS